MRQLFLLILCLSTNAQSVEYKAIINEQNFKNIIHKATEYKVKQRSIFFLDSKNWALLNKYNILLRLRTDETTQSTLKVRDLSFERFEQLSTLTFSKEIEYKCEVDQVLLKEKIFSCSISFDHPQKKISTNLNEILHQDQLSFLKIFVSEMPQVELKGEISSSSFKISLKSELHPKSITLEKWSYANESTFELSTKEENLDILGMEKLNRFINDFEVKIIEGKTKTQWFYDKNLASQATAK